MGTAIKHPVLDWVKPSFVFFDIQALWCSAQSVRVPEEPGNVTKDRIPVTYDDRQHWVETS